MTLASRSHSFRALAIAFVLAGVSIVPAYAQDEEDNSERPSQQRGRAAALAALEERASAEANRAQPAIQEQARQELRRENIQRQPQLRSSTDAVAARQQAQSMIDQREQARQARQAQQRGPVTQLRGERERQSDGDTQRQRAQRRELALHQQGGIAEREAEQRRELERRQ